MCLEDLEDELGGTIILITPYKYNLNWFDLMDLEHFLLPKSFEDVKDTLEEMMCFMDGWLAGDTAKTMRCGTDKFIRDIVNEARRKCGTANRTKRYCKNGLGLKKC